MEIRIDIDREKQKAATHKERKQFLDALFWTVSQAIADYGAHVDFSDSYHWVITFPDEHQPAVSALFGSQKPLAVLSEISRAVAGSAETTQGQ